MLTDAATSVLVNIALASKPVLATNYERAPRVELLRSGMVFMRGSHLELTIDGMQAVLPLLAGMLGCAEVSQ